MSTDEDTDDGVTCDQCGGWRRHDDDCPRGWPPAALTLLIRMDADGFVTPVGDAQVAGLHVLRKAKLVRRRYLPGTRSTTDSWTLNDRGFLVALNVRRMDE